jgi:Ser/Thr protein kinase RdoA (MazF antagonist)
MEPVARVLALYPGIFQSAAIVPLGNRGGFSGALLWQLHTKAGVFCLRAGADAECQAHLLQRHALMIRARAAGLYFAPAVIPSSDGSTVVEAAGRCWELMDWMPGRADFHAFPTPARLSSAVAALARLHCVWQLNAPVVGAVPAVARRLEAVRSMPPAALTLPRHPLLRTLAERSSRLLARWLPEATRLLHDWENFTCPLQPCLRDVWHDNLLFDGDVLTGLVDYAGCGLDNVATDLARLLGSLIGDDEDRWSEALNTYRSLGRLSSDEQSLARVLDRTGVIASLCNWLCVMCEPETRLENDAAASRRVETLLRRVEKW